MAQTQRAAEARRATLIVIFERGTYDNGRPLAPEAYRSLWLDIVDLSARIGENQWLQKTPAPTTA